MARYSAAYPTGREHTLKPLHGRTRKGSRERGEKMDFISMWADPMEVN